MKLAPESNSPSLISSHQENSKRFAGFSRKTSTTRGTKPPSLSFSSSTPVGGHHEVAEADGHVLVRDSSLLLSMQETETS